MEISIRTHIINNFKGDDLNALRRAIEESIKEEDELTLPGMGVFLELIWQGADKELQDNMLEIVKDKVLNSISTNKMESCSSKKCSCEGKNCKKKNEEEQDDNEEQEEDNNEEENNEDSASLKEE